MTAAASPEQAGQPAAPDEAPLKASELSPARIVAELDRHIVGQAAAKRAVAVALRNRWRRQRVDAPLRDEILPKNILMVGPTGVGKTEIARRLARLAGAPFVKVEATRFTEVGYVGRDVSSIIRDLMELAVQLVRSERLAEVQVQARERAVERVLDLLLPLPVAESGDVEADARHSRTRDKLRRRLEAGELNQREVTVEVESTGPAPSLGAGGAGLEEMGVNLKDLFGGFLPKQRRARKVSVVEALHLLTQDEAQRLVDDDNVSEVARARVEQAGIVFLDEVDKITSRREAGHGPDVSREGVQRDLLPIVEGTTVQTRHGMVQTDHILFIAAGAFHLSKPSDLLPEFQGRFPIRVELEPLSRDDLQRILTEPRGALVKQYTALLATEGVELVFEEDAIARLAAVAEEVNRNTEDIGARRLHTVLERLLETLSFEAAERQGERFVVNVAYVDERLAAVAQDRDLSRYIL